MLRFRLRMGFAPHAVGEAVQTLRTLVGPVRAEPGCRATQLLKDVDDGFVVVFVAEWQSRVDLERHLRSEAFRKILAVMELAAGAPVVEVDEVSCRRGFDLVEDVLGGAGAREAENWVGNPR